MPFPIVPQWVKFTLNDRIACVFSADDCARIVETYAAVEPETGGDAAAADRNHAPAAHWIRGHDKDARWVFERLERTVRDWNDRWFNFQISECQDLQVNRFVSGQSQAWRTDLGVKGLSRRKLCSILMLSRPESYQGGTIEFFEIEAGSRSFSLKSGDLLVFAPWLYRRILPVTEGTLWLLTAWWTGRPLR